MVALTHSSGHIEYLSQQRIWNKLIVALNSDLKKLKKEGKFFMPFSERSSIVSSISYVDEVIDFDDDYMGSCINALEKIKKMYPKVIYFANGGDRNNKNIPDLSVDGIKFLFSVGGDDKKNSSSWILNKWQYYFEQRNWDLSLIFQTRILKLKN